MKVGQSVVLAKPSNADLEFLEKAKELDGKFVKATVVSVKPDKNLMDGYTISVIISDHSIGAKQVILRQDKLPNNIQEYEQGSSLQAKLSFNESGDITISEFKV